MNKKPIDKSYNFLNENLFCGEYPGNPDPVNARKRVKTFTEFGIQCFIDLTEEKELKEYDCYLPKNVLHHRFPIRDTATPDAPLDILPLMHLLDNMLSCGQKVYLHCWGGIGRTGLAAACYACWQTGCSGEAALHLVAESFRDNPKSNYTNSPENEAQCQFVRDFAEFLKNTDELTLATGVCFPRAVPSKLSSKLNDFLRCVKQQNTFSQTLGSGDLDCYLEILTHLKMKPGCRLHYKDQGDDVASMPVIFGKESIIIDKSPEGAWEAFLLETIGDQFNLRWHAGTQQLCIVTSWRKFFHSHPADEVSGKEVLYFCNTAKLKTWDITPRVEICGDEATVYYCMFNAWDGFRLMSSKVHFSTAVVDMPETIDYVPYFCPVIF